MFGISSQLTLFTFAVFFATAPLTEIHFQESPVSLKQNQKGWLFDFPANAHC